MMVVMYIVGFCVFVTYIFLQIWEVYYRGKEDKGKDLCYYSRHDKPEKLDEDTACKTLNNLLS